MNLDQEKSKPGQKWLVGTELNLVNRLAEEMKPHGVTVQFMSPFVCMCSTMQRIDLQHLAWALSALANNEVVNQIKVSPDVHLEARIAIDRMLDLK